MSKEVKTVEIPEEDFTVEEQIDEDIAETPTEKVIKKEGFGAKAKKIARKIGPFAVIGGALALAFAMGKTRGSDAMYQAMLEEGSEEETEDEESDAADETAEESGDG